MLGYLATASIQTIKAVQPEWLFKTSFHQDQSVESTSSLFGFRYTFSLWYA